MKNFRVALILTISIVGYAFTAIAEDVNQPSGSGVTDYQIIAQKLDAARNGLLPETGSSIYSIDQQTIQNQPLGDFNPINDVLLQAPGVAQDSYGQLHVRGDHADLQYRLNGVILPEGITGFGQTLDTHFVSGVDLLTGALPAEYSYKTAGIVDITTKTAMENGARSSVLVGSNNTLEGNQEAFGSKGPFSYYISGTYDENDRGVEPPTKTEKAIHDQTYQNKEFGYFSYVLNPDNRLSVILGNSTNLFQIPNNPGQTQNFTLSGTPTYPSANLNENQSEHNTYEIVALQGAIGDKTDYQVSLFSRQSDVFFQPDPIGDLIYNGIASRVYDQSVTTGIQSDNAYHLNDAHTIRSGFNYSYEQARSNSFSGVFPADSTGAQTGDTPFSIPDNVTKAAQLAGFYLQDEWKAIEKLTINYGARFDYYTAYVTETQIEPRLGAIYDLTPQTKLHAGYARNFTPPDTQFIAPADIQKFQNTTGQLPTSQSSNVVPEKDNYFDAGVVQEIEKGFNVGVDAYYKQARDLLDEGQFGQALILGPFNYDKGRVKGIEFTADYKKGDFSSYANLAISKAEGKGLASGQYNFGADEQTFIANNWVHLDHDQTYTGSAGVAYKLYDVTYSGDLLYGSGLRDGFANTGHLPFYTQVNLGVAHSFDLGTLGPLDAKLSVINLLDNIYEIRNGTGIGVFAPQYGPGRGFFLALSKPF